MDNVYDTHLKALKHLEQENYELRLKLKNYEDKEKEMEPYVKRRKELENEQYYEEFRRVLIEASHALSRAQITLWTPTLKCECDATFELLDKILSKVTKNRDEILSYTMDLKQ
jgi:hypothetical protein